MFVVAAVLWCTGMDTAGRSSDPAARLGRSPRGHRRTAAAVLLAGAVAFCGWAWAAEDPDTTVAELEQRLSGAGGRERIAILNQIALSVCLRSPSRCSAWCR